MSTESSDNSIHEDELTGTGVPESLREKLAEYAHDAWAGWMEYLLANCEMGGDGAVYIPLGQYARWKRQMETPYSQLTEKEKESDRKEADRIHDIVFPP